MIRRLLIAFACAASVAAAALGAVAAAASGGPSPGVQSGWDGIKSLDGTLRYVALTGARSTVLARIRVPSGRVLRYASIPGAYGIPMVAYDGTLAGLTRNGKSLVLATSPGQRPETKLAVVSTTGLKLRQVVTLPGTWAFDAVSPDGRMLYLIQYVSTPNANGSQNYRVRAYDLSADSLVARAIVDRREPKEAMRGLPLTRTTSGDGVWAFTLYQRSPAKPFIHALNTVRAEAFCIDLPWKGSQDGLARLRIVVLPDGRLALRRPDGTKAMVVSVPAL
jgi:hypothetical protein